MLITLLSVPAPDAGEMVQVTPLFEESLCTVAENCCVAIAATVTVPGVTVTEIGGGVTVTVNTADLLGSATAVTVTVAVAVLATLAGASYSTELFVWLFRDPGPVSFQVTPFPDESLDMITVMVVDCPCVIVCELLPVKLIEITSGGVLAPELQPLRIIAARHPTAVNAIRRIFSSPRMANLLSQ
jgi:hypothetical protein